MSDIFYTSVDKNLRLELNRRAAAGRKNRSTKDINYMLTKIANVQITPYDVEYVPADATKKEKNEQVVSKKTAIKPAILGGGTVRQGEFLPTGENGFLNNRKFKKSDASVGSNTSNRIPPIITGLDIQLGDGSMGVMQTATVSITIPNPNRDLNYFETVYLRPGRNVTIYIQHPDTAILTQPYLDDKSMPSTKTLKELYPELTKDPDRKYQKMNAFVFTGLITSFTLDYQSDASIAVGLNLRGTTQAYTDTSMAMNNDDVESTEEEKTAVINFYEKINAIFEKTRGGSKSGIYNDPDRSDISYIWGTPYANQPMARYITLRALVEFVNTYIISKTKAAFGDVKIICENTDNLCTSKYYEYMISVDPTNILFPGNDIYGETTWLGQISDKPQFANNNQTNPVLYPSLIYISMDFIQKIIDALKLAETYMINDFFIKISEKIYSSSGGAIQMNLITHPEASQNLLYYDSNNVKPSSNVAQPYSVPMFANDPIGTIVKDFKFNGKLPADASTLAYVLNQDPANISESEIAPFLSYVYSANQTTRDDSGNETITNLVPDAVLNKMKAQYKSQHENYVSELTSSISAYGKDFSNKEKQLALSTNLTNYIQYPKPSIEETTTLKSPVIPFDASFTIDGINGFRYGDVLEFKGLPIRYTQNTVFSIVGINHNVDSSGQWNTGISCIMRPRLDS